MFCRTKKVKEMIDELKDEIKTLKDEVKEAKKEPEMSVPVFSTWSYNRFYVRDKVKMSFVLEQILAHLGMEIVKEPKKDEKILIKKKPKTKKAT
jgi:prefoldin subunit 5